ncbi:MAG: TetR/AcrR family transcriptional regulator [Christensenellales bacterium]|jgi:AcrR family transcriptional regulator
MKGSAESLTKKTENQRVRLTKRLLRESLLACMEQKPIERISVKEICERAELNRSTFYLHYGNEYDLLGEMEEEAIGETRLRLQNVGPDVGTKQHICAFLQYIRENGTLFRVLLCQKDRDSFRNRFVKESLLFVKPGIVFTLEEPQRKYVYAFLLHGSLSVICTWVESGFDLPPEQVAEMIFDLSDRSLLVYR